MENYLWQKTLLDMYNMFDRVVIISDNKFDRLVANSLHNHATNTMFDEMVTLMARKNNCLLAKEIVDKALKFLMDDGKSILHNYYKKKISFKNIAEKEQINIRQIFRNFDKELASFAYYLSKIGYSTEVIQKEFGKDNIFAATYDKLLKRACGRGQMIVELPFVYNDDIAKSPVTTKYNAINVYCD